MTAPDGNVTEVIYDTSNGGRRPADSGYFGKPIENITYAGDSTAIRKSETTWTIRKHHVGYGATWAEKTEEVTTYEDDTVTPKPFVRTEWEDWVGTDSINVAPEDEDGHPFGRFETVRKSGSAIGDRELITYTDYAIGNADCQSTLIAEWLPGPVARSSVSEKIGAGAETLKELTEYAIDLDTTEGITGRTIATVRRESPSLPSSSFCADALGDFTLEDEDVVTKVEYDEYGNVEKEETYLEGSSGTTFGSEYVWDYGVPISQKNLGLDFEDFVVASDGTLPGVDPATSLVIHRYNFGDGVESISQHTLYDELRRPIEEQYGSIEPTTYTYEDTSFTDHLSITRDRMSSVVIEQGSGDQEIWSEKHYDTMGRVFKVAKIQPDGSTAYQYTTFDEYNRNCFSSEWTTSSTAPTDCSPTMDGTTTDYTIPSTSIEDPFGRPRIVTGSLGEVTTYDYFGTNKSVTVEDVRLPANSGPMAEKLGDSTTTYYTDGLERLIAVDSPATGMGAETDVDESPATDAMYSYDYAGRLVKVELLDTAASGASPCSTRRARIAMRSAAPMSAMVRSGRMPTTL